MINSLKTIAFFGCRLTSRYRQDLVRAFNDAAEESGVNIVYFHSIGEVGDNDCQYAQNEHSLSCFADLDRFDGIIFDGEGYTASGNSEKIADALRRVSCPVVSISSYVDGFINIMFEDAAGIKLLTEHFIDVHGFTRIGFMSGYLTHPDARTRLDEFRSVMRSRGLPEDGAGVFEGDFWFGKGSEAAEYFLSLPERPQAIVCANDYMAISLINAFKRHGVDVPSDIAVSGFDGTVDGQEFFPKLTSATRERKDIARKSLDIILNHSDNNPSADDLTVYPRAIYKQSCGCMGLDYDPHPEIFRMHSENYSMSHNIRLSESALLKLSRTESVEEIGNVFATVSSNFGEFDSFFLAAYTDSNGRVSFDSDYGERSDRFTAVISIDKSGTRRIPENGLGKDCLIPDSTENVPQFYYIMSVHSMNRLFGYAVVSMKGHDIYNEFYTLWIMNMVMMLDNILKNSKINKLIGSLKQLSTMDVLTGMLNRRGFELFSDETIRSFDREHTVCTMVLDMDGLKKINDIYGHHEGDAAIKSAADIIAECCKSGEISARTGGDEFYIFAPDYSQEKLDGFISRLNSLIEKFNSERGKPYELSISYGTLLTSADADIKLEELLKISDTKMYEQKLSKPNRR